MHVVVLPQFYLGGGIIKTTFSQFGVGLDLGYFRGGAGSVNTKCFYRPGAVFLCVFLPRAWFRALALIWGVLRLCPQLLSLLALLGRSGMLWEKPFSQFGVGLDLERRRVGKKQGVFTDPAPFFVAVSRPGRVFALRPICGVSSGCVWLCPQLLSCLPFWAALALI